MAGQILRRLTGSSGKSWTRGLEDILLSSKNLGCPSRKSMDLDSICLSAKQGRADEYSSARLIVLFGANKMKVPNEGNDKGVVARQGPKTG